MRSALPVLFLFLLLTGCGPVLTDKAVGNQAEPGLALTPTEEVQGAESAMETGGEALNGESRQSAEEDFTAVEENDFTAEAGEDDFIDNDFMDEELVIIDVYDPIEPFNRGMFWVNDKLYFYLFKPVAKGLRVVPEPARQSVSRFFTNLATPARFANSLLQLKFADAGTELGRLVINSTLGIGGLFDPAKAWFDLARKDEDFGQTLGSYGVGNGIYIVWPILGPSSARDTVGMAADFFLDPLYYINMKPLERLGLEALDKETNLSLDKDTYEAMKRQALDPYLEIRTSYAQHREGKVKQ